MPTLPLNELVNQDDSSTYRHNLYSRINLEDLIRLPKPYVTVLADFLHLGPSVCLLNTA